MKKLLLLFSLLLLVACPSSSPAPTTLDAAVAVIATATATATAAVDVAPDLWSLRSLSPSPQKAVPRPRVGPTTQFAHFAAQSTFVYQPGGTPSGIVYADWPSTAQAIKLSPGTKLILIDSTLAAAHMTAGGPYNLDNCVFAPIWNSDGTLTIDDGASFTFTRISLEGGMIFASNANTSPIVSSAAFAEIQMNDSASLVSNTSTPLISVTSGVFAILFDNNSVLGDAVHPVVTVGTGLTLQLVAFQFSFIRAHSVKGLGNVTFTQDSSVGTTSQDNAGLQTTALVDLASQVKYTPAVATNWSPVPSAVAPALDQLAARTTGTILTAPTDVAAGSTISIVHAGANNFVGFDGTAITYQLPATLVAGDVVQVKMAQTGATPSIITARGGANIEAVGSPGTLVGVNGSTSIGGPGACTRFQLDISTLSGAGVWRVAGSC